ncbi:MAG: glycoside hydrolase family 3 protein [Oscillospiraceae bacterium]
MQQSKNKSLRWIVLLLGSLALLSLCACGQKSNPQSSQGVTSQPTPSPTGEKISSKAEELMKDMSNREKVGQLFIIRPESLDLSLTPQQVNDAYDYGVTALSDEMAEVLKKYPVGGIALFGKNIQDPGQLKTFIGDMQHSCAIPLFMGVDEEGGKVSRVAQNPAFPVQQYESMAKIGESSDEDKAYEVGATIGEYLKDYSFNLDFAPVADVNTNPKNPVIGTRAFGSDEKTVAKMVTCLSKGLEDKGIISCIKHFPGHGDTKTDTHDGYASTQKNWQEMLQCEIVPFKQSIDQGVDMVMVAHITAENVTSDGLPSSLSQEMISEKLKGELNFKGVVITDAMAMGAITKQYSPEQAAIKAINAGVDIVLMPQDFICAYDGVLQAVEKGEISQERLDESVLKVLKLKEKYGLL